MDGNFLIIPSPTFIHFRCGLNENGQSPPLVPLGFLRKLTCAVAVHSDVLPLGLNFQRTHVRYVEFSIDR